MSCHAPRSITQKHYATKKFRKLHKALRVFRRKLDVMFGTTTAAPKLRLATAA